MILFLTGLKIFRPEKDEKPTLAYLERGQRKRTKEEDEGNGRNSFCEWWRRNKLPLE
jgi:hypothetical protein